MSVKAHILALLAGLMALVGVFQLVVLVFILPTTPTDKRHTIEKQSLYTIRSGTASLHNASEYEKITGTLSVIWGDSFSLDEPPIVILSLTDDNGVRQMLHLSQTVRLSTYQIQRLSGNKVTVFGYWLPESRKGSAESTFLVANIHNLNQIMGTAKAHMLEGNLPYLSLLCSFPDGNADFENKLHYQQMYGQNYPMLGHYWAELSYGRISLKGSGVAGPYQIKSMSHYDTSGDGFLDLHSLMEDCISEADPHIDFDRFYGLNLMFNGGIGYAGYGSSDVGVSIEGELRSMPMTWLGSGGWVTLTTVQHEMGHSFGLPHSSGDYGYVYDNVWDVMSAYHDRCIWVEGYEDFGCSGHHTIAYHKELLGWLQSSDIFTVTEGVHSGITLQRLAKPGSNGYLAINIPSLYGESAPSFSVEVRQNVGYDMNLPGEGIIIHEIVETRDEPAHVVDIDGNGDTGDEGAIWTVGEIFVHPSGVVIKVVSQGTTSFVVDVEFNPDSFANCKHQPSLSEVECEALLTLYDSTSGQDWERSDGWDMAPDPCDWFGVTCADNLTTKAARRTIVELMLYENQLAGTLPTELADLKNLRVLDVGDNYLNGNVPPQLGSLVKLEQLFLSGNQLTGSLPRELMSLSSLSTFYYHSTDLCEPSDNAFQSWLHSVQFLNGTGIFCDSAPTLTPTVTAIPTVTVTPRVTPTTTVPLTETALLPMITR